MMRKRGSEEPETKNSRPRDEITVIGRGAKLEGNLLSAGSLRVEGRVQGHIAADGDVTLVPGAEVTANIKARNVVIGSHYSGDVIASGTLEIEPGARLEGNISCGELVINKGAFFSGEAKMTGGSPAAKTIAPAS